MAAAAIYLSETLYEALFDEDINANTYPTTTNYIAIENYFANLLNGKIGIEDAITADPALSMCRLWVGYAIREFSAYNRLYQKFGSSPDFVAGQSFLDKLRAYDHIIEDIRQSLSTELKPAYWFEFDEYGGTNV